MAKIKGTGANKELIDKILSKIKASNIAATAVDDKDKETFKGKVYLKEEKSMIEALDAIVNILGFADQEIEEEELLCYGETGTNDLTKIYMEPSKQEELFDLVNSSDVKSAGISFPKIFGEYGEIPNTNRLKRPRPRGLFETVEKYEEYLENHYKDTEFKKQVDENGVRKPYEHEKFIWSNGTAIPPQEASYKAASYADYLAYVEEKNKQAVVTTAQPGQGPVTQKQSTDNNNNNSQNEQQVQNQTPEERQEKASKFKQMRENIRNGARLKVKQIKNFWKTKWENIKNDFATFKDKSKEEKFKMIKKYLVAGVLILAGGVLATQVAGPLLAVLGTGTVQLPIMISGAITGFIPSASGTIALTAVDRIVYGLIAAAVPAAVIVAVRQLAKLGKQKQITETPQPQPQPNPGNQGTPTGQPSGNNGNGGNNGGNNGGQAGGNNGNSGNNDGNNNGDNGDQPDGTPDPIDQEPTVIGATPEEKIAYIRQQLIEIGNLINESLDSINLLEESPDKDQPRVQAKIQEEKEKVVKLNTLKDKYIRLYNAIIDEAQIEIITDNAMGGATI